MPTLETAELNQKAVLWTGPDSGAASDYDDYGEPKVDAGIEVDVRWENRKREIPGPGGTPVAVDATVVMDRAVAIGSQMWLGKLRDYVGTETKLTVVDYQETPDLKGRHFRRVVLLARASNTLAGLNL